MKSNNMKLNRDFYKTYSFWLGVLAVIGLVGDVLLKYNTAVNPWIMILIAIYLFLRAFTSKRK
ncbi:pirin [Lactiplantibacillus paraplantarum]|uniref:Pirin n=1 Tax=Lactiplantibacillus paraplantarum TaxID=60520 RepID=A0A4Q9Y758_9LACO|nr:pirin [Lactiplantibacillus paraplantarum]